MTNPTPQTIEQTAERREEECVFIPLCVDLSDYDMVFKYTNLNGFTNYHSIIYNLEATLGYTGVPCEDLAMDDSIFESPTPEATQLQSSVLDFALSEKKLSPETDYIVKLVEDVLLLLRSLQRAETKADYMLAIVTFAKLRSTGSLTNVLLEQWDRIMVSNLQAEDDSNHFSQLRDLLENYEKIKTLPIFKKFYKFLLYCLGTSLYEKLGVKFNPYNFLKIEKAAVKRDYSNSLDFVHCMLDTSLFLCETGYQCMLTGSLDPFLHDENSYEGWHKSAELLKRQSRYITNPEPHGFTVFDFLNRLDSAIEKGVSIVKFQAGDPVSVKLCRYTLNELHVLRADALTKRLAQQDRKAPFAVLVAGGSSVGKSTFTKMLYYHFGKKFNLPIEPEYRYVRNPFDQYWTNFNSSQWCVQLDDIAFLHPGKSATCDPSLMEMLQVVNNVPYVPTQADIADKGKTPLRARFVIATTNTEKLNANDYFACPLAVQRRLPYVFTLHPKKEYLKDGAMLDTSKLPPSVPGTYPDFWQICVKKVKPNTRVNLHMGQTAELEEVAIFEDINSFLLWFNVIAEEAEGTQQASMDCDKFMSDVKLCECGIPVSTCNTHSQQLQAVEDISSEWITEVMSRRNDSVDTESDYEYAPGEELCWRNIMKEISTMDFFSKIIVLYYYFILYWFHNSTWFRMCLGFFFGKWYFFWILCRLLHYPQMRHIAYHVLGYRTYRSLCRNKNVVIFAAAITSMLSLYKAFSFIKSIRDTPEKQAAKADVQGLSDERGEKPVSKGDKQENVWYKDTYECTQFDVVPATLSRAKWTPDETVGYLRNNLVNFTARWQTSETVGRRVICKATCIVGRFYLVNNHSIKVNTFELDITFQSGKDGVSENMTVLITSDRILRIPERDIMFIELPVPPRKDIRSFFPKRSYRGRFNGEYIGRNSDGSLYRNSVSAPKFNDCVRKSDDSLATDIVSDMWSGTYGHPTSIGDCGSLLISYSSMGPLILGMHVLGMPDVNGGFALSLCEEDFEVLSSFTMAGSTPTLQVGEYTRQLGELHHKSPVRYIEQGSLEVYGSFIGFRSKKSSSVCKTFMSDLAVEHGYERNTSSPMMNSWIPWRKALLDMVRPVTHIDTSILKECSNAFKTDILSKLTIEDLAEVKVYDNVTALNGFPGLAYVDKLNRNTSAGFPFRKSKKFFLNAVEPIGDLQHPVEVTSEIQDEVDSIIECYESGKIYQPVFTASLKDEPTSIKKCIAGKTRVFCGAPMPWSIVVRKYLLSIIRLIQKNRFLFEAGPGTIAQSKEWDDIYKYVTHFGTDRIVAGDYGKFDKRMPASVILEAYGIIISIIEAAGWSERDIRVVRGIAEDTAYPTIDFNGDLIRCYGSNPSGHPLTVIINGLANSLYVRYCYYVANPLKECSSFKENVKLMTYGDDMIAGVSNQINWFHHTVMKDILASLDIEFTMADKEALSVPFITIEEATFLRRSWRFEPELGYFVCPIEHASIDKMLTMCVKSKTVSLQFQAMEVMHTVVREYFWYGKEVFNTKRNLMSFFVNELNLQVYQERDFPTWEQLVGEFVAASQLR